MRWALAYSPDVVSSRREHARSARSKIGDAYDKVVVGVAVPRGGGRSLSSPGVLLDRHRRALSALAARGAGGRASCAVKIGTTMAMIVFARIE